MATQPYHARAPLGERLRGDLGVALALLILVALLMLAPLVWVFSTSLRLPRESFSLPPKWLPTDFYFRNYASVFEQVPFFRFFFNSLFVSGMIVLGQLVTASMAAYAFARLRFPGKAMLFALLMSSLMIPIQATIIPVFVLLRNMQLSDTLWALILPAWSSAFGVFLLRQYFLTIPDDLEDAARLDGASTWQIFTQVVLPLAAPALAVLAILTFNNFWNEFFRPLILITSYDKFPLPLGLVTLQGYLGNGSISVVLAGVALSLVPVMVLYVFAQKYLIEGITLTGIKG
ncbi:MAG: carbohydrate ABC transporter permease [Chloroflexota bacterium]|nr:carbohydrate ABC transporter permease [Chloroflexota bacterium]